MQSVLQSNELSDNVADDVDRNESNEILCPNLKEVRGTIEFIQHYSMMKEGSQILLVPTCEAQRIFIENSFNSLHQTKTTDYFEPNPEPRCSRSILENDLDVDLLLLISVIKLNRIKILKHNIVQNQVYKPESKNDF